MKSKQWIKDKEAYAGKKFTAHYKTNGYYDIYADTSGFCMKYVPLEKSEEKSFDDEFFGEWLEEPVAYAFVSAISACSTARCEIGE